MGNTEGKLDAEEDPVNDNNKNNNNNKTNNNNNNEKEEDDNFDDDSQLIAHQVDESDDDDDEEDEDQRGRGGEAGEAGGETGMGMWKPGMDFPALDGIFPVIRVISNLSTTSLKEVSTRRSRTRKKRHAGSVAGGGGREGGRGGGGRGAASEATTFYIYSDTSGSSACRSLVPRSALEKGPSSNCSDISASDSASNSAWKNVNQNRLINAESEGDQQNMPGGVLPLRAMVAGFLFCLVVGGLIVVLTIFILKQKNNAAAADKEDSSSSSFGDHF